MRIRFTYEVISHKSAKQGDYEDNGFYIPDINDKNSIKKTSVKQLAEQPDSPFNYGGGLVAAIETAKNLGCVDIWDKTSLCHVRVSSVDPDIDCTTGYETYYTVHFEGVSERTRQRLLREFNV